MELTDPPRGPYSDDGVRTPFNHFNVSSKPDPKVDAVEATLESIVGLLVLPLPLIPECMLLGSFVPCRAEIEELHAEVQYCLWSMHISLSVYMKLLYLVDISVRQEVSDVIGRFLADWGGGRGQALSDALDVLIISEFLKHSIVDIPDMESLQRNKYCASISSTVATYIKDIAIKLDAMRQGDVESTIDFLFPISKNFIGRCFFLRLAAVSSKLLELIKSSELDSDDSMSSTLTSSL